MKKYIAHRSFWISIGQCTAQILSALNSTVNGGSAFESLGAIGCDARQECESRLVAVYVDDDRKVVAPMVLTRLIVGVAW